MLFLLDNEFIQICCLWYNMCASTQSRLRRNWFSWNSFILFSAYRNYDNKNKKSNRFLKLYFYKMMPGPFTNELFSTFHICITWVNKIRRWIPPLNGYLDGYPMTSEVVTEVWSLENNSYNIVSFLYKCYI